MPLTLFHHETLRCFQEAAGASDRFNHTFGGDPAAKGIRFVNLEQPPHLLYHLNLADPAVGIELPAVNWLPLCYGFGYADQQAEMLYRVLSDSEIEWIAPQQATWDPDFPYDDFPVRFPERPIHFVPRPYDATRAEDALSLAAVFGVDRLSHAEMERAIELVEKEGLFREWRTEGGPGPDLDQDTQRPDTIFSEWSAEDLIRRMYKEPFMQAAPERDCENPNCTAEIAYRTQPISYILPQELLPDCSDEERTMHIEARDVRRASKRVFALQEPASDDRLHWQLIWQICDACGCITVDHQCT